MDKCINREWRKTKSSLILFTLIINRTVRMDVSPDKQSLNSSARMINIAHDKSIITLWAPD